MVQEMEAMLAFDHGCDCKLCLVRVVVEWLYANDCTQWEFAGFLFRAFSTKNQQQDAYQIVSQILILLAPM
jgi:hypothetical protein